MFNVAIGILGDFVYMSGRKPPTQSEAIMVKIPNYTENYQRFPFFPMEGNFTDSVISVKENNSWVDNDYSSMSRNDNWKLEGTLFLTQA